MVVDWSTVETQAIQAVKNALAGDWNAVATGVSAQISALISVGQQVETAISATPPQITQSDYDALKLSTQRAIEGVMQTYAAIGIVVAEQVANAAINVVVSALKTAYPAVGILF